MNSTHLELHVPNFSKVKEFYSKLGFSVVWEREPENYKGYLVLRKDDNILCFWGGNEEIYEHEYFKKFPSNTPPGYRVEIIIQVADLENYYQQIEKSVEIVEPLQTRSWGLRDFRIVDPCGFYIRISEPHDVLDSKYAIE